MQQGRRSADGRQWRNAWSGFENQGPDVGGKRKSEEEEVQDDILDHQEEQGLPKELHEGGGQEVATSGYGASKNVESACSRDGSHGKAKFEEADGSSRGQKGHDLAGRKISLLWPPSMGQKGCGLKMTSGTKRSLDESGS